MQATTLVLVLSNDDLQDYSTDIARFAGERVRLVAAGLFCWRCMDRQADKFRATPMME